ncbi:MAG: amino acid permease, partial [Cytophagaceae bacterium]|nr:amino acid permease [Cytophagaceae bacterium]
LAGARVSYAMARDGLFFRKAAELNRHGVPGFALVIQCVWEGLLCLSGTYGQLLDYTVFVILIFYILTIGGVFILRRRRPDAPRPYRAFGYPVLPALYMVFSVLLCLDLLWFKPDTSGAGLVIVALGIPVFWLWRAQKKAQERT